MSPQRWGYDINHQRTLGVYAHTSTGLPFLQPYSLYRSQSPLLGSLPLSIRLLAGLLTFPFVLSRVFPQVFLFEGISETLLGQLSSCSDVVLEALSNHTDGIGITAAGLFGTYTRFPFDFAFTKTNTRCILFFHKITQK